MTAVEWFYNKLVTGKFTGKDTITFLFETAKEMEKEQIMKSYDIGSNEGYDLAKIDDIEEGNYMKEPIEYYNEIFTHE
jgi:hypothetical protein